MIVRVEKPTNPRFRDLDGKPFGRWTVIAFAGVDAQNKALWLCRCSCPLRTEKVVRSNSLIQRHSQSCGCLKLERVRTHGRSFTPEYRAWAAMVNRCCNEEHDYFLNYGGRGVCVCSSWSSSFETFLRDVGCRPSSKHSLDRIDNDGHYSCGHCEECLANGWPANCRWATQKEQCRNKRSNRLITYNGETKTMTEWAEERGMNRDTLWRRLSRLKWSTEDALFRPVRHTARATK